MPQQSESIQELESIVIRFAGDSGDGMQLTGNQFTNASALFGNDIATLPDFPAEIRAPAGTVAGVSGFQLHFSSQEVHTPGEEVDILIALNPAALKANLPDLNRSGTIIIDEDYFTELHWKKAGYDSDPLEKEFSQRIYKVPITKQTLECLKDIELPK